MTTLQLGQIKVQIDEEARTVTSIWPDGVELVAKPNYDEESIERARELGYSPRCDACTGTPYPCPERERWEREAVWQMTADHAPLHHLLAQAEGEPWSWHLKNVAEEQANPWHGPFKVDPHREECLVLLLHRIKNLGGEVFGEMEGQGG